MEMRVSVTVTMVDMLVLPDKDSVVLARVSARR